MFWFQSGKLRLGIIHLKLDKWTASKRTKSIPKRIGGFGLRVLSIHDTDLFLWATIGQTHIISLWLALRRLLNWIPLGCIVTFLSLLYLFLLGLRGIRLKLNNLHIWHFINPIFIQLIEKFVIFLKCMLPKAHPLHFKIRLTFNLHKFINIFNLILFAFAVRFVLYFQWLQHVAGRSPLSSIGYRWLSLRHFHLLLYYTKG